MNRLRNKLIEIVAKQNMREDVRVNPPSLGLDELVIELCVKLPPEMRTLFASSNIQINGCPEEKRGLGPGECAGK